MPEVVQVFQTLPVVHRIPELNKGNHDPRVSEILFVYGFHQTLGRILDSGGMLGIVSPDTIGKDQDAEAILGAEGVGKAGDQHPFHEFIELVFHHPSRAF